MHAPTDIETDDETREDYARSLLSLEPTIADRMGFDFPESRMKEIRRNLDRIFNEA